MRRTYLAAAVLYRILHVLMGAAIRLYFSRIHTDGLERIDAGRPALILANHTSTFLDPMLLAIFLRRKVHFYTRGDVFKNKLAARIFRSLGMMPIYRRSEGVEHMHQNDATNEEALRVLRAGGAVLIFAEGLSEPWKVVKPLKKGPFRLAAMAVAEGLDVAIVPLGINYLSQTHPGTPAWLRAGVPLEAKDFFGSTAPASDAHAVTSLLRAAESGIRAASFDARRLARGPATDVLASLDFRPEEEPGASFEKIAAGCRQVGEMPEEMWTTVEQHAARLVELNRLLGLSVLQGPWSDQADAAGQPMRFNTPLPSPLALNPPAVPPFIPGVALPLIGLAIGWLHAPPLLMARRLAFRLAPSEDFFASVYISLALVLTLVWYVLLGIALELILGRAGLAALPAVALISWLARHWSWPRFEAWRSAVRWRRAKQQNPEMAAEYEALAQSSRNATTV